MLFISPQKLFSFSRYLSFCPNFLVMCRNGLIKKRQQAIFIHILPNISRNKGNQTVKLGQLIKCNMRNIFFEKPYTKPGREASPRPFSEK